MSNNIHNLNEFRNLNNKATLGHNKEVKKVNELVEFVDNVYQVTTNIDIPQGLVNAFAKKVKDESTRELKQTKSDAAIAELIADYIKTSFVNIENLPTSIVLGSSYKKDAQVQVQAQPGIQDAQNTASQIQSQEVPLQPQAQTVQGQAQTVQGQAQPQAQTVQGQPQPQTQTQGVSGSQEI